MRRSKPGWGAVAVLLFAEGTSPGGPAQDPTVQITEQGYVYDRVEVAVGGKLIFQNATRTDRTVVIPRKAGGVLRQEQDPTGCDSGFLKPRTSWEYVCSKEGMYNYYCKEDRTMTGMILVRAAK